MRRLRQRKRDLDNEVRMAAHGRIHSGESRRKVLNEMYGRDYVLHQLRKVGENQYEMVLAKQIKKPTIFDHFCEYPFLKNIYKFTGSLPGPWRHVEKELDQYPISKAAASRGFHKLCYHLKVKPTELPVGFKWTGLLVFRDNWDMNNMCEEEFTYKRSKWKTAVGGLFTLGVAIALIAKD
jgi:hypothetical protein